MIRPGRWRPAHSTTLYGTRPTVGTLLAFDFRAWRVLDITDVLPMNPEAQKYVLGVAPLDRAGVQGTRHILEVTERRGRGPFFDTLSEHYAVCGRCGDLPPCREVWSERQAEAAAARLERFDRPGFCPACEEPITLRQKTVELPNIVSPLGGTVLYHRRWKCLRSAETYEQQLVAAGAITTPTLSCGGRLIHHVDGTHECLNEMTETGCPGLDVIHRHQEQCRYRSHGCPRLECQTLEGDTHA